MEGTSKTNSFLSTSIEYLKGVGPERASLLNKELNLFSYGDLLMYFPFRYEDRTKVYKVNELTEYMDYIQLHGRILKIDEHRSGYKSRLLAVFADDTGTLELVWFQGVKWIKARLKAGSDYVVFGKLSRYGNKLSIAHPEIESPTPLEEKKQAIFPVYNLTEKLRAHRIDNRFVARLTFQLVGQKLKQINEALPDWLKQKHSLLDRQAALDQIHYPSDWPLLKQAEKTLKFEELFYLQVQLLSLKVDRKQKLKGQIFKNTTLIKSFYHHHCPFPLTKAQEKVIREIYHDLKSGIQMNRLLQGDVGSGKTIVAFVAMLAVVGSGGQCALMAPTEILAQQHYKNLQVYCEKTNISIALLTGSIKGTLRKEIKADLASGALQILVGTHALLEEEVKFSNFGLAVVDEQHRFGVVQRSKLWQKNPAYYPHVLVMTATPIPRTLAMTLYGDLDISIIDELPKGRKPVKTMHLFDSHRLYLNNFIKERIQDGAQVYIVYPLIEESEKLDLKDLMDGYESITRAFPDTPISILHGKMNSEAKEFEMARFKKGETKIMVATTVIEVGVDVPNASVMVIESGERFGLSQLHQLRGRVGRGAQQSYCILVTSQKLSNDAKVRVETMVRTNNGFEIAEIDLKLRGPGDISGTQQSGLLELRLADISKDNELLRLAREEAQAILEDDPHLNHSKNTVIRNHLASLKRKGANWSRIS